MNLSWGIDLWDRLDPIINHSNTSSVFIDKTYKCIIDCHTIWTKAAHKQKRLLEKLQLEIRESELDEFTLTSCLMSIINNLTSICNIESTFHNSVAKASEDYLKKTNSQIKKQSSSWSIDKKKMEDDFIRERRKYDLALRRYRYKHQALLTADENFKKSEENSSISHSQIDLCQNMLYMKRNEYDDSKREYTLELQNFNGFQQHYFKSSVVEWARKGEKLYEQRLQLLKNVSNEFAKYIKEMLKNLSYSIIRFTDSGAALSFEKDAVILVQKFKTGDVPPGELQFIDLDTRKYLSKRPELIRRNGQESSKSSDSGSGTSSYRSNAIQINQSMLSGSYSTMQVCSSTRPPSGRPPVQNVKTKQSAKMIHSESIFSINTSKEIFPTSNPWEDNKQARKSSIDKPKSIYQKRGRNEVRENCRRERSHSVSDMISNVILSSFHRKSSNKSAVINKDHVRIREAVTKVPNRRNSSDFDTDSSQDHIHRTGGSIAPEIVSTPAEAVAMVRRQNISPDYCTVDSVYEPSYQTRITDQTDCNDQYQSSYVGSCVSYHDYEDGDPTNGSLSFKAGDQFYILGMDQGSGWLFVTTVDQKVQGFVPLSYMKTQWYDKLSEDII